LPDELDEIRQRLDALERRMDSEAGMRAMMDLDQASLTTRLDVQDNLLRALAVTQSEHTSRFARVEGRLARVEDRLARVEDRLTRVEDGQGRLEERQAGLEQRQGRLEIAVGRVETGIQTIIAMLGEDR
jgi:chromosome segregation ATPase